VPRGDLCCNCVRPFWGEGDCVWGFLGWGMQLMDGAWCGASCYDRTLLLAFP